MTASTCIQAAIEQYADELDVRIVRIEFKAKPKQEGWPEQVILEVEAATERGTKIGALMFNPDNAVQVEQITRMMREFLVDWTLVR